MKTITILILGMIAGFGLAWAWRKNRKVKTRLVGELQEKKGESMKKILDHLAAQTKVTNDEIEKLLGVSHATAFRYLQELQDQGVIRQVGGTGAGVYYEKI